MVRDCIEQHAALLVTAAVMALAGCVGGNDEASPDNGRGAATAQRGGTISLLTQAQQIANLDPQPIYVGEDAAFASAHLHRALVAYKLSADSSEATGLVPDLATTTGTPSDGAKTWAFTLKDGPSFEDGLPITCTDVKYGVSRVFATDVIVGGPGYAISLLDIPTAADGTSVYKGPYVKEGNDTAAFDEAVECSADDSTITFHLARPVGDFNYTTTLLAFGPVPKAADTGEKYNDKPVPAARTGSRSTPPQQLVLVRSENWDSTTDDFRSAYPDQVVLRFGVDPSVIDQRLIAHHGTDKRAMPFGPGNPLQPVALSTVFGSERYADRRVNELAPATRTVRASTSASTATS